jgi:hypothetical protein
MDDHPTTALTTLRATGRSEALWITKINKHGVYRLHTHRMCVQESLRTHYFRRKIPFAMLAKT